MKLNRKCYKCSAEEFIFSLSKNEMSKVLHWASKARFVIEIINYIEVNIITLKA